MMVSPGMVTGEVPVRFNRYMREGQVLPVDGTVWAHCAECLEAYVKEFNDSYAILETVPICLLDKRNARIVDVYPREDDI